MEITKGTSLVKSKSSNSTIIKSIKPRGGKMSTINLGLKESKKRGVYVEKWESPKQFQEEEIKKQPEESVQPKHRTEPRTSTSLASTSKISTSYRLAIAPNPGQARLRKPANKTPSPTTKFPKKNSTIPNNLSPKNRSKTTNIPPPHSPKKQPKPDSKPGRNIIEENKNQATKFKFRSNALRQTKAKDSEKVITFQSRKDLIETPSNASKLTRDMSMSDHVHWSKIFPSDPQNKTSKNRLEEYIDNFKYAVDKSTLKKNNMDLNAIEIDDPASESNEKDKQIYNFFRDLLETVYDEKQDTNPNINTIRSGESSEIKFEIEENVAQKLYTKELDGQNCKDTECFNRYTIKDEDYPYDQSQQLADYYRTRRPVTAQMTYNSRRKTRINKRTVIPQAACPKTDYVKWKKPKNQNLLSLLKQQLSTKCNSYEEPETMYQALHALARQKRQKQINYFNISVKEPKSDSEKGCRFKRRNVITPSTGLPRNKLDDPRSSNYKYITTRKSLSDSSITNTESNHSLEVLGYDFHEFKQGSIDYSDSDNDNVVNTKSFTNLNRGITTISQYWKS